MSRKGKGNTKRTSKFKGSLAHSIRRLFDQSPDADLSLKEICHAVDIRESELREQAYQVLKELAVSF